MNRRLSNLRRLRFSEIEKYDPIDGGFSEFHDSIGSVSAG